MADLLTSWTTGPVADLLASEYGWLLIPAACATVLATEAVLIDVEPERVRTAVRSGVVTAALLVAVHLPLTPGVTR